MDNVALTTPPPQVLSVQGTSALPASQGAPGIEQAAAPPDPFKAALEHELARDEGSQKTPPDRHAATTKIEDTKNSDDTAKGETYDGQHADPVTLLLLPALPLPEAPLSAAASRISPANAVRPTAHGSPTNAKDDAVPVPHALHALPADSPTAEPVRSAVQQMSEVAKHETALAPDTRATPIPEIQQPPGPHGLSPETMRLLAIPAATSDSPPTPSSAPSAPVVPNTAGTNNDVWAAALSQRITWIMSNRVNVAELHVHPPELGPVKIRLTVSADDNATASAQFASPHASVRDALEAALPKLRETLADSGVTLGSATVSDGTLPRGGEQYSSSTPQQHDLSEVQFTESASVQTTSVIAVRRRNGLVDTFA